MPYLILSLTPVFICYIQFSVPKTASLHSTRRDENCEHVRGRISKQLQVSHSSEAAPSQPSDTTNSPGRAEYLLNRNRSSTKPSVTSPKPKNSQVIREQNGEKLLHSYLPIQRSLQRRPHRRPPALAKHSQFFTISAPTPLLPCSVSETQGAGLGSSLLSLSKSAGAAAFQPAFCSHLPLLLQPAASGSQSTMHRAMNASLLSSGNSPWNNSLLKYMMSLPNIIYAPT